MKYIKSKDSIAILVVVFLIVAYIGYQFYTITHIGLETQTAVTTTVYDTFDAEALVVRDEHVVDYDGSAITLPVLSDGDKINVGGNIAATFSSKDSANAYSKYNEIKDKLDYYETLESQSVGQATNVESINAKIDDDVDSYIRSIYNNKGSEDTSENLNSSLIQRQMIIGEKINFTSITQDLRKQAADSATSAKAASFVKTKQSGVFSSYTDGYEDIVDYKSIEDQSIKDVKELLKKVDTTKPDKAEHIGKLITSYNWYLEMIVPAEEVKGLSNGDFVTVALKNNDEAALTAEIVKGADLEVGAKETLLILKCNDMNSDLATIRKEPVEIRYNTYKGIKVPAEALHVVDGKKGVFALIASQVQFRTAEVVYSEDDWVLLSYQKDSQDGIRLYDKIIIQGKDLEDGKVYT